MTNVIMSYIIQGLFVGIGTTIGSFIATRSVLNRFDKIVTGIKKELLISPNQEKPISKPVEVPQEQIATNKTSNGYDFSSKIIKRGYTYYALIPQEIASRFSQIIGVRRVISLKLITKNDNTNSNN